MNALNRDRAARVAFAAALCAVLSGCILETREEQDEKQVMQKQVQTLQHTTADVSQKFAELDDEIRRLNGRAEVNENNLHKLDQRSERNDAALQAKLKELQERMTAYKDAIAKLEQGLADANGQIAALSDAQKRAAAAPPAAATGKGAKGAAAFDAAEERFAKKDWKAAIPDFEAYRKQNPSGKHWREATYKIGVSFQELGMADDAQAFYDELMAKAPGSPEAKKAQYRLKALKK